jgi:hypothetical protein
MFIFSSLENRVEHTQTCSGGWIYKYLGVLLVLEKKMDRVKTVHVHAGAANIAQARRESKIKQAIPGMAPLSRSLAQNNDIEASRIDYPLTIGGHI